MIPGTRHLSACLLLLLLLGTHLGSLFELDLNEPPPEIDEDDSFEAAKPPSAATPAPASFLLKGAPLTSTMTRRGPASGKGRFGSLLSSLSGTLKSKLPKYFDFDEFRAKFGRGSYKTTSEFIYRKATYFKQCMLIFKSKIEQRLARTGAKTYSLEVNKFADRSPNEIKRMFMSAPPIELKPKNQSLEQYKRLMDRNYADRESWDIELDSQASLSSLDGQQQQQRQADDDYKVYTNESQLEADIESMLKLAQDDEVRMAILEEIEGRPIEVESQADLKRMKTKKPLPWPFQARPASIASSGNSTATTPAQYKPPKLSDGDYLNWSEHECFHTIYDQKDKCGKCYVIATTAMAEFYKCAEQPDKVERRKFSKDYVLDCAVKYKPASIYGCKGGSMLDTMKFIGLAGVYNIRGWREKLAKELARLRDQNGGLVSALDEKCPLNMYELELEKWGAIHLDNMETSLVHVNGWLEALQDGPLVASVQMPDDIALYSSGVHDGHGCAGSQNWHTMILVGYGLDEQGVAYWRFRNSFGPDWGNKGHFDLAMEVPGECLIGGVRIYRR